MVTELKTVVENNATAAKVEEILKTYLCTELGDLKAMCDSYVNQYVPEVMQLIAQNLVRHGICYV